MRPALPDEAPLETPVVVGVDRLLGVHRAEVGAPAAPEHVEQSYVPFALGVRGEPARQVLLAESSDLRESHLVPNSQVSNGHSARSREAGGFSDARQPPP